MAVQPVDLAQPVRSVPTRAPEQPGLRLIDPPPPRRVLVGAVLWVVVLAAIAGPSLEAAREDPITFGFPSRPPPATSVTGLDSLTPMKVGDVPKSPRPVASLLFVRCTHLWATNPDGGGGRVLLDMAGISSPTFSPDARTIAFFGPAEDGGQALYLAPADGSSVEQVGALRESGWPLDLQATGLQWAPSGETLAFALSTSAHDELVGGSVVWTLDLASGEFASEGSGRQVPFWVGRRLGFASATADGARFENGRRLLSRLGKGLEDGDADYAASLRDWRWGNARTGAVVLRSFGEGDPQLVVRRWSYSRNDQGVFDPPPGHDWAEHARPELSQDGGRIYIGLVDDAGEPDVGLLDTVTGEWRILDYGWEPEASPAPTVTGPLEARRAAGAARSVLGLWRRVHGRMLADGVGTNLLPFNRIDFTLEKPVRRGEGWMVEATAWGKTDRGFGYLTLDVRVSEHDGRLLARPAVTSEFEPVATIEQAVGFLDRVLETPVLVPRGLPEGTRLAGRYPVWAYRWGGGEQGGLNLRVPMSGAAPATLTLGYGENYFTMGCGGEKGEPTEVAGESAMWAHSGPARQVIWPATKRDQSGEYSVYGVGLRGEVVRSLADSIEAQR
ncbi:MAG: TolB family protein [Actinomycetota bacterium]